MLTLWLVCSACASVAGPASRAATLPVDCLDVQGQRELLAGIELELGPQAAQLARCNARVGGAERYAAEQGKRAEAADARAVWVSVVVGVVAASVGAVAGWGVTHATTPAAMVQR
jgi:hypothetical protein